MQCMERQPREVGRRDSLALAGDAISSFYLQRDSTRTSTWANNKHGTQGPVTGLIDSQLSMAISSFLSFSMSMPMCTSDGKEGSGNCMYE